MSLPVAFAAASAGLSIASSLSQNAAITKSATAQYGAQKLFTERDYGVLQENLVFQGQEVNNQLGMALTQVQNEFRQAYGKFTAKTAETNAYGNTAQRAKAVTEMKQMLSENSVIQAGESKMLDVQNMMREAKYKTEARHVENMQAYNNAMSQRQSTFSILAGAASAGLSGYSSGLSIEGAQASLATNKKLLASLG